MNSFEERYFPLKRAFVRRSERYCRCRMPGVSSIRIPGSKLTLFKIPFPTPVPECAGKRLAFVSDWHWHSSDQQKKILQDFQLAMQEFKPDFLLLGGDLCDDAAYLEVLPELLQGLSGTTPEIFAVNGNWETGKRWLPGNFFTGLYAEYHIRLLCNESVISGGFRFYGLPDISSLDFKNMPSPPENKDLTDILLVHSPDGVIAADHRKFLKNTALALCGHNHGGQIRIPGIGALYCPSFYHRKYDRGIFCRKDSDMKMIVSSGIGEHCKTFRLFCPPEAVLLEFV